MDIDLVAIIAHMSLFVGSLWPSCNTAVHTQKVLKGLNNTIAPPPRQIIGRSTAPDSPLPGSYAYKFNIRLDICNQYCAAYPALA